MALARVRDFRIYSLYISCGVPVGNVTLAAVCLAPRPRAVVNFSICLDCVGQTPRLASAIACLCAVLALEIAIRKSVLLGSIVSRI